MTNRTLAALGLGQVLSLCITATGNFGFPSVRRCGLVWRQASYYLLPLWMFCKWLSLLVEMSMYIAASSNICRVKGIQGYVSLKKNAILCLCSACNNQRCDLVCVGPAPNTWQLSRHKNLKSGDVNYMRVASSVSMLKSFDFPKLSAPQVYVPFSCHIMALKFPRSNRGLTTHYWLGSLEDFGSVIGSP